MKTITKLTVYVTGPAAEVTISGKSLDFETTIDRELTIGDGGEIVAMFAAGTWRYVEVSEATEEPAEAA